MFTEFNGQRASYQRSGPRASYPGPSSLPNRPPSRPDSGGSNSNLPPYDPRMPPQPPPMPTSSSSSMPPAVYPPPSYAYPPSHPPPPPHMRPDSWSSAQQSSSSWNLSMAHPSDQRQPPPPPSHMSANPSRKQSRNSHESSAGSSKRQRLDREAHSRRKPPSECVTPHTTVALLFFEAHVPCFQFSACSAGRKVLVHSVRPGRPRCRSESPIAFSRLGGPRPSARRLCV